MIVNKIHVQNFRNIINEELELSDMLTVICGDNGQGKTNFLESIWMLTGAKSFRNVKDYNLVRLGESFAIVNGNITQNKQDFKNIKIAININDSAKTLRKAFINGVDYSRASSIAGEFICIVFEPNHLKLVKAGPETRRNFVDIALCQLYPNYLSVLRKYTRLTAQKNALLKQYCGSAEHKNLIFTYNDYLAECGQLISDKRYEYVQNLLPVIKQIYNEISHENENIDINFLQCYNRDNSSFSKVLNDSINSDINAKFCTKGPHREDLIISINNKEAKSFASQGQQRSAVLALKMAEANEVFNITGNNPVLLFDDVLSELDDTRQNYILNNIKNKQTVITSCNASLFKNTNGKICKIKNGKLINA